LKFAHFNIDITQCKIDIPAVNVISFGCVNRLVEFREIIAFPFQTESCSNVVIWKISISVVWNFSTPLKNVFRAIVLPRKAFAELGDLLDDF
jgi:hypothetical protein